MIIACFAVKRNRHSPGLQAQIHPREKLIDKTCEDGLAYFVTRQPFDRMERDEWEPVFWPEGKANFSIQGDSMKTYTFHVSLPDHGRVWRKLELPAEATLENLHLAIQDAYDFDADHLYSFFMSGKAWDSATEYTLPEGADPWSGLIPDQDEMDGEAGEDGELDDEEEDLAEMPTSQDLRTMFTALKENPEMRDEFVQAFTQQMGMPAAMVEMMLGNIDTLMENASDEQLDEMLSMSDEELAEELDEEELDDEAAGDVRTTTLESLALKKGKTFMYLFDYGDEWRFKVKVDAINNNATTNAEYPRLVEAVGEAPAQYADGDEDDSEEDGEGI
jgi:hypothetical protein